MSATVVTSPDPCSKGKQQLLLDRFVRIGEVWVATDVGTKFEPVIPIFGADLIIHCRSGNRLPASVEITSEVIPGVRCASFQDKLCGKGKRALKWVRNGESGTRAAVL